MLKSNKRRVILALLVGLCIVVLTPFINGLGCNASFIVLNPRLGSLYGKCEYGKTIISVKHEITHETYIGRGFMGYWHGRYFLLITSREFPVDKTEHIAPNTLLRPFYYRNFYTGNIVGDEMKYMIYSSPEPTVSQLFLNGEFGIIP
ncbi:hypothetical protein [Buttiauxella ferragutiae]|uniref:hypothetical protein n=1 Tax=Buttiauxella ferragutiae TaxID=82989 RepID=UPI00352659BA